LAFALLSLRRPDDAIKVWQDLLKFVPDDRDAIANLGRLLYQQKRYSEAEPVIESEVKSNPASIEPLSRLGMVYLRTGELDKGYATMQEVLKLDSGPGSLNNVAFELADTNAKLPEALGYAEKAVREQEETSQTLKLAQLTMEDLRGTQQIGSYWDTLGWAHFRLGHLDQAEKYIRASWLLSQRPDVADHLGQVYEQQHNRETAIHMYRLALAALDFGANPEEIQSHLSRLLPGANLSTGFDLHRGGSSADELSRMRTVKLTRIVPGSASAEFFLLFGPGAKLEDVKFISGSDKLKPAEKAIRTVVFPVSYPDGSAAHLVRRAIVACFPLSGCELVLYDPVTVRSVD
jgi:tetratricopeptide (TPR) repeat protein